MLLPVSSSRLLSFFIGHWWRLLFLFLFCFYFWFVAWLEKRWCRGRGGIGGCCWCRRGKRRCVHVPFDRYLWWACRLSGVVGGFPPLLVAWRKRVRPLFPLLAFACLRSCHQFCHRFVWWGVHAQVAIFSQLELLCDCLIYQSVFWFPQYKPKPPHPSLSHLGHEVVGGRSLARLLPEALAGYACQHDAVGTI